MKQKSIIQFILGLFVFGFIVTCLSQSGVSRKDKYKVDPMKILKKIESDREARKLKVHGV